MIALVATLVERSRGTDHTLSLATRDYNAIAGGKGFPFLYQQIKDNINPNQTRLLIHALCRYDERLAGSIIAMLFNAVTKHTEVRLSAEFHEFSSNFLKFSNFQLCGPFFKLLTLLTESSSGPSGLPCFSQLVLQRVWDAAEFCPQPSLEWLAIQAPRNKVAHTWILSTAENWVEQFLIAHPNLRVRNGESKRMLLGVQLLMLLFLSCRKSPRLSHPIPILPSKLPRLDTSQNDRQQPTTRDHR
jgi:ubiquitin carboxyl-terminal hydrolase 34